METKEKILLMKGTEKTLPITLPDQRNNPCHANVAIIEGRQNNKAFLQPRGYRGCVSKAPPF